MDALRSSRPGFRALVAVALLTTSPAAATAQTQRAKEEPPKKTAVARPALPPLGGLRLPTPEEVETLKFGSLAKRVNIYLVNAPWPLTADDVYRIVGDPWEMNPQSRSKIRTYLPRVHLAMFSFIADHMVPNEYIPNPNWTEPGLIHGNARSYVRYSGDLSRAFFVTINGTIPAHFRPEEMQDIAVFVASRSALFPKTRRGWQRVVNLFIQNNAPLAVAVTVFQVMNNALGFRSTGYLPLPGADTFRMGWYTSGKQVGAALRPILDGGILLGARGLDASFGAAVDVDAANGQTLILGHPNPVYQITRARLPQPLETERDIIALENELREHFLSSIAEGLGFFASVSLSGKYIIAHTNTFEQGRYYAAWQVLLGRERFVLDRWAVHGLGTFSTDFRNRLTSTVIAALEDRRLGLTGAVHIKSDARYRLSELQRGNATGQIVFLMSASMPADLDGNRRGDERTSQPLMQELRRLTRRR